MEMRRALGRLAGRQPRSTTHVLPDHTTETQYMTPFDETTWTINEPAAAPTRTAATDTRPQGELGIISLGLGITSWTILVQFFAGARSPYSGWAIFVTTVGAIVFGAIGMRPAVARRGLRRGAAIAGLVLGFAVIAGLLVMVAHRFPRARQRGRAIWVTIRSRHPALMTVAETKPLAATGTARVDAPSNAQIHCTGGVSDDSQSHGVAGSVGSCRSTALRM